jgi:predicted TIM-barrel fold metal-dependent hydrolase
MQVDGPERFEGWRKAVQRLAQAPNVACKIPSGLGMGDWTWTTPSIRSHVEAAIDAFGAERCMFASSFPVGKLFSSYGAIWDAFRAITAGLTPSERRALFHDNAARFAGCDRPPGLQPSQGGSVAGARPVTAAMAQAARPPNRTARPESPGP